MEAKEYWKKFIKSDLLPKLDEGNVLITGPAGVGKSTLIKQLKEYGLENDINVVVTAMTGIAALSVGGVTLHRFSGIDIKTSIKQFKYSFFKTPRWRSIAEQIKLADIIVIDEVSMIRGDVFQLINHLFQIAMENEVPFGGKQLVLVGDFYQLSPIIKSDENIPLEQKWLFTNPIWLDSYFQIIYLDKVFRQRDPEFLSVLNKIREGKYDSEVQELLNRAGRKTPHDDVMRFFSTNREADLFNKKRLEKVEGKVKKYRASIDGNTESYEKQIIKSTIAEQTLELKVGAKVMTLVNDPEQDVYNGSFGKIISLDDDSIKVEMETGNIATLLENTWESIDETGKITATFTQMPVKLGYAVTIHKSQGLTFTEAFVDASRIFAYGQLYVALSRVTTQEGLYVKNFSKWKIKADPLVSQFYDSIEK